MDKRYTLTVTYDEANPRFQPGTRAWGDSEPDRIHVTALTCELTPEQWEQLKTDTLRAWSPKQDNG